VVFQECQLVFSFDKDKNVCLQPKMNKCCDKDDMQWIVQEEEEEEKEKESNNSHSHPSHIGEGVQ